MNKSHNQVTRSKRKPSYHDPAAIAGMRQLEDGREALELTLPFDPAVALEEVIDSLASQIGVIAIGAALETDIEAHAGRKHAHLDGRPAMRHGYEEGWVWYNGKRIGIRRPRARTPEGELDLPRYRLFQLPRRMKRSVLGRVLARVSMRRYAAAVDEAAEGHGIEKSSISRHWKVVSAEKLAELIARPLGDLELTAVMIDGVGFKDETVIVALGIDGSGRKHVLGLTSGSTENASLVTSLLNDLVQRGLDPSQRRLFVLDGAKALLKGVRDVFGSCAVVQRCRVHKLRNILDKLPEKHHWMVATRLRAAWGMNTYQEASEALKDVLALLENLSAPAAESLREGMEATLTLHRLGIPPALRTSLYSTNPIENLFSSMATQTSRVRNWKAGDGMVTRWAATMLLHAEARFHRIKGYGAMPALINALAKADLKAMIG
jgi:putative transposase